MKKEEQDFNNVETHKLDIADVGDTDYRQLYHELYENVAKMLVENRKYNWTPQTLLNKWDIFRK
jgi:hypothetical protein